MRALVTILMLSVLATPSLLAGQNNAQRADTVKRINRAATVFKEIMGTPDKTIPVELLDKCECVAIVPGMTKGGIGLGGRYGKGVVMCRKSDRSWSPPSFLTIGGGSFGLQLGLERVDLVMLIMNRQGMEKLLGDNFTIGADASAAAGPVGRHTSAETNIRMDAEILTWSRAKGLFAGITLNGAVVKQDKSDNRDFYGQEVDAKKVLLESAVPMPAEAVPLAKALSIQSPVKLKE